MRLKDKAFLLAGLLAACGSIATPTKAQEEARPPVPAGTDPRFVSRDTVDYDEVGYATWYGEELGGKPTASGEPFLPDAITAAHPSLPLPSFVEVTALDSGRTILVRVNDRGPFGGGLLIDLSRGASEQLGVAGQGRIPVRVRKVNPPQHEKTALTNGQKAAERLATPPALLNALRKRLDGQPLPPAPKIDQGPKPPKADPSPKPVKAPPAKKMPPATPAVLPEKKAPAAAPKAAPAAASGRYFVQIAALSNEVRARSLAKSLGGSVQASGKVWRVRTGPYASEGDARIALGRLRAKGYPDASIAR